MASVGRCCTRCANAPAARSASMKATRRLTLLSERRCMRGCLSGAAQPPAVWPAAHWSPRSAGDRGERSAPFPDRSRHVDKLPGCLHSTHACPHPSVDRSALSYPNKAVDHPAPPVDYIAMIHVEVAQSCDRQACSALAACGCFCKNNGRASLIPSPLRPRLQLVDKPGCYGCFAAIQDGAGVSACCRGGPRSGQGGAATGHLQLQDLDR